MSTTTTNSFDAARFARATEERDASTQLSMYADDATVTIIDQSSQPSSPRTVVGRDQIKTWLEDVTGRDMTHRVGHAISDENGAAYIVNCRYPSGAQVVCATVLQLDGNSIARQTVVQVWDES
jgi:SnoaL-like domain